MKNRERRGYYRAAADQWIEGVRLQSERCAGVRDGNSFFDSNFLVVAVHRLREVARMSRDDLKEDGARVALRHFDDAHPEFVNVRNYQEHINDPHDHIGSAMYFSGGAFDRLRGDGGIERLIDPKRLASDAEDLYQALCDVLGEVPEQDRWTIRPPRKRTRR